MKCPHCGGEIVTTLQLTARGPDVVGGAVVAQVAWFDHSTAVTVPPVRIALDAPTAAANPLANLHWTQY